MIVKKTTDEHKETALVCLFVFVHCFRAVFFTITIDFLAGVGTVSRSADKQILYVITITRCIVAGLA